MTHPADFEVKIGFSWIREKLQAYCLCGLGIGELHRLAFSSSAEEVWHKLNVTAEFMAIRGSGEIFPLRDCIDPTPWYPTIRVEGAFLETESLASIALALSSVRDCVRFLATHKLNYPALHAEAAGIVLPDELIDSLCSRFDEKNQLKDQASTELSRIRRQLSEAERNARKVIDRVFRELATADLLTEAAQPVLREGRIAIPVRAENKRRVRGIILGESATGQTVFIEPAEVVEANNEIRDLQLEERREVVRILKTLTSLLREHFSSVENAFRLMGVLDWAQAKARFSSDIEATVPDLGDLPCLRWSRARHPLLWLTHKDRSEVVPLTINLDSENRFLLVSGPNAGGKSVCLKTVCLLQYMLQCGMPVPMDADSQAGIFDHLFVDIGDQQSIENDLSTYSSHLQNMNYFLRKATDASLVLMDELGAGTDPNFGGGIAEAILEQLVQRKVWGVATTHYYNLKLFASNTTGIRNGAMLFDTESLRPLFRLEIDKPGSSFALEIARKTGLPEKIIQRAQQIIGEDLAGLEKLMKKVADDQLRVQRREAEAAVKEEEYKRLATRYRELWEELEAHKKEIITAARTEAATMLQQTNREIEKTIRHIRENKAEKKETRKVRENLRTLGEKVRPADKPIEGSSVPIKAGDRVRLVGQEGSGTVLEIKGSNAVVQFGEIRSTTKLSKLVKTLDQQPASAVASGRSGLSLHARQARFNAKLDIRGKRVDEVLPLVDQFIDDAVLLGHGELRILHGKGEGVLRRVIRDQLKEYPAVTSWHDEHVERGGDGITVVVLK